MASEHTGTSLAMPAADPVPLTPPRPGGSIPQQRFTAVERARLFPRLIAPITLFSAPAGMGKTVLASQWVRSPAFAHLRVCWVRVPEAGSGPGELWRAIREALTGEEVCEERGAAQGSAARFVVAHERTAAHRAVTRLTGPTMLIIDDYQRLTRPALDLELAELPELSAHLHLTVLSRRFAALDGPLVAARSTVQVCSDEHFAFTVEDSRALGARLGLSSERLVDKIHVGAGGWPYAVRLLLNAITDGATVDDLDALSERFVTDYTERSLSALGQRALYITAVCDRVSIELLSETIGLAYAETASIVDRICELGLGTLHWYPGGARLRCHPGFATALRRRARRELGATETRQLQHQHAIELSHDEPEQGIRALLSLREYADASRALSTVFPERIGVTGQVFEPLHGIPIDDLTAHPFLLGAFLLSEIWNANCTVDEAMDMREALRVGVAQHVHPEDPERYFPTRAILVAVERLDDDGRALELARALERELLEGYAASAAGVSFTPLHLATPFIFSTIAETGQTSGDLRLAARCFQRAAEWAELLDAEAKQYRAYTGIAVVAAINGETARARSVLAAADELTQLLPDGHGARASLNVTVARLLIAAEAADPAQLADLLATVTQPHATLIEWPYLALAEAEIVRQRDGNLAAIAGLDARIREAKRFYPHRNDPQQVLEAYAAQVLATHGNYRESWDRLATLPQGFPDGTLGRARLALLRGDADAAVAESSALLNGRASTWLRIAARLVRAAAHWSLGDAHAAAGDFQAAAEAMTKHGTHSGLELIPYDTLTELAEASPQPLPATLARVIRDLPASSRCEPYASLTEAELRILEAIAESSAPLPVIAESLFVTPHTVKFHLRSVYRKLRVAGREAAAVRAREIGIVDPVPAITAPRMPGVAATA